MKIRHLLELEGQIGAYNSATLPALSKSSTRLPPDSAISNLDATSPKNAAMNMAKAQQDRAAKRKEIDAEILNITKQVQELNKRMSDLRAQKAQMG